MKNSVNKQPNDTEKPTEPIELYDWVNEFKTDSVINWIITIYMVCDTFTVFLFAYLKMITPPVATALWFACVCGNISVCLIIYGIIGYIKMRKQEKLDEFLNKDNLGGIADGTMYQQMGESNRVFNDTNKKGLS